MRTVNFKDTLESKKKLIFIDTRSPLEYAEATIPNSFNIPIFSNEERAEIGTIYKKIGPRDATKKGLDFIAPKLNFLYDKLYELSGKNILLVCFCARGGMRSSSVVSLFSTLGFNIVKLEGGYKGYRGFLNENLPKLIEEVSFVTLYGKTGTGKTLLLKELKNNGADILDLEGAANHRGSILGSLGLNQQFTQKQFESNVLHALINRKSNLIFTEGESKRIGKIVMPTYLYEKINSGEKLFIDAPIEYRKKVILDDYINEYFNNDQLLTALEKLGKYISKEKLELYKNLSSESKFGELSELLMLDYYDLNYKCSQRSFDNIFINQDEKICAVEILEFINKKK